MFRTIVIIVAAVFFVSGCGSKSNTVKPEPLVKFEPTAKVKKIWKRDFGKLDSEEYIKISPFIYENLVFTSDLKGKVSAYAIDSGKRKWKIKLKQNVTGAVGFGDSNVYLGTKKGIIIALDSATGEQRWKQKVSSEILAPPLSDDGIVIVQSADGKIIALASEDGKPLWSYHRDEPTLSLRGTSTPVIFQGIVVSGFAGGTIVAIRLSDGRVLWEIPVAYPRGKNEIERLVDVDVAPVISRELMFAAGYQGKLVAINLRTGRQQWSKKFSTYSGMDIDSENIYLTDDKGNVVAFDQQTGASLWKQAQFKGRQLSAPATLGEYIVVGDLEGYVHFLAKEDGSQVARYRLGHDPINVKPIASNGTLFVSNLDGDLAALRID